MRTHFSDQNSIEIFTKEQLSRFPSEIQQQFIRKSQELSKRMESAVQNAFVMGASSISKIAIKEYKPEIDEAKDYTSIRAAVDRLLIFLAKGDNLR